MTPLLPTRNGFITVQDQPFVLSTGETVIVPAGYYTDGHTVLIMRAFIDQYSYDVYAAIYHDYAYENRIGTRSQADWEYVHLMHKLGSSWLRRNTFYLAVRAFGWIWWYS